MPPSAAADSRAGVWRRGCATTCGSPPISTSASRPPARPGEEEVAAYAAAHAAELAAASADDRVRLVRARLEADRRRELIADWLAELRRRIPVVEIKD